MRTSSTHTQKEKKIGHQIKNPKRTVMNWKTVLPALAVLGVGGYYIKGRQWRRNESEDHSKQ